ncbi:hypothetical protein [Paenibacillus caui]|uniref:hypothetical protein n=1 Tax=Paenibacillus caui TaxID=2873927 RepID=UPI001CA7EC04|nr:hypothetical protein [Paenibacillus caui]
MTKSNFPNFPDFPDFSGIADKLTLDESILLLFSSVALEEIALSHLINAEAEKLDTLLSRFEDELTFSNLLSINHNVQSSLSDIVNKEMLLLNKLENIVKLHKNGSAPHSGSAPTGSAPTG